MNSIPFHRPAHFPSSYQTYLSEMEKNLFSSEHPYYEATQDRFSTIIGRSCILVGSGTQALELIALDLAEEVGGGEIIIPSYSFSSCANAFLRAGFTVRFCDVELDGSISVNTMNRQVNKNTVAVLLLLYGGNCARSSEIADYCLRKGIKLIVDAAHSIGSRHRGRSAVDEGDYSCISFHFTKNISAGEGGAVFVNKNSNVFERLLFRRDKGTDRSRIYLGVTDKYTWQVLGGNFRMPAASLALLMSQLDHILEITNKRRVQCLRYHDELSLTDNLYGFQLSQNRPEIEAGNGHLFALIAPDAERRTQFILEMNKRNIACNFHYQALHLSPFGKTLLQGDSELLLPTSAHLSSCLVRLPTFFELTDEQQSRVIESVQNVLRKIGKGQSKANPKLASVHNLQRRVQL